MNFDVSGTECIVLGFFAFMAYVGAPALLVMWDSVLDYMGSSNDARRPANK